MKIIKIKSLIDNYIWIVIHKKKCVIIDPGSFSVTDNFLKKKKINPIAVLLTHHHKDHTFGVPKLQKKYKNLKVYGPKEICNIKKISFINNKTYLKFDNFLFFVFSVPGHTLNHVMYYQKPYLFCGDTLFSGGCGKIFEGTYKQMYNSIKRIKSFPNETLICPAHEYTLENIKFANHIFPFDKKIKKYKKIIEKKTINKQSTLPTTLKLEKKINIFLRSNDTKLQKKIGIKKENHSNYFFFKKIRKMKDQF